MTPIVEEIETKAQPSVDARLVMSFPAQWGGTPFVEHLHTRLTNHYRLPSRTKVYVDSVAARVLPASTIGSTYREHVPADSNLARYRNPGLFDDTRPATIKHGIDPRPSMRLPDGRSPFSYQRDDWNTLFEAAIRSSRIFLIVFTRHYIASKWCKLEVEQAMTENRRRSSLIGAARTRAFDNGIDRPLRFIALSLGLPGNDNKELIRGLVPNVEIVESFFTAASVATLKDDRIPEVLPAEDFARLINRIGSAI